MEKQSTSDLDFLDDMCLSALFEGGQEMEDGDEEILPLSDSKCAEKLQFQEALMSSVTISRIKSSINPSKIMAMEVFPEPNSMQIITNEASSSSTEPSSPQSFCEICAEKKETNEMFRTESCVHSFCNDCISRHVETKIRNNIRTVVLCPGLDCKAVLELDLCRPKLSKAVIDVWEDALCHELISASQRFYCPFKDCSAMLVDDREGSIDVIREAECPFCHRLFCALCYVPWHSGFQCEEFQRLHEDEKEREAVMLRELAKNKKWCRCPHCKFYVERIEGCFHMTCRCKFQFCYGCGAQWTGSHSCCQR